jgi:hypothetical protein
MNTFDRPGFNPFGTSLLAVVLLSFAAGCMQSSIVRKDASESAVNDMDDSSPRILDPLYNAGHVDPGVALDKKMGEISSNGVYCEVCHNISASTGIVNAPFVLTPRKYGRPLSSVLLKTPDRRITIRSIPNSTQLRHSAAFAIM